MGTVAIETPLVVTARDYHDFGHMLDVLNLAPI